MTRPRTTRLYAVMLGEKEVSRYDTREDAEAAIAWYVETYRETSEPLTVEDVQSDE